MPASDQAPTEKFDLRTHIRDKKGRLVATNTYRCHIVNGSKFFERPVGSGNLWFEDGTAAGRWVAGKVDKGAEHIAYTAPQAAPDTFATELQNAKSEAEQLRREIAAIKNDQKMAALEKQEAAKHSVPAAATAAKGST